jgi:peptide/nickel transport system permease protein
MAIYTGKRLGYSLLTLVFVSFAVFFLIHLIPGDPAAILLGLHATPESIRALRHSLGLDRSLLTQYGIFMRNLFHGDLGTSLRYDSPALSLVLGRLPATLFLIVYSAVISLLIAFPIGTIAALRREKLTDHVVRIGVLVAIAIPAFWIGTIFVLVFSLHLGWFPASGYGSGFGSHLSSLFLPALTLSLWQAGLLTRNLRSAVIDVVRLPYVDFARLRGLRSITVLRRHVLRTSLGSTVTLIGVNVGFLLAGAVVVENVFSVPGSGSLLVDSVFSRDYPVVQATTLIYAVLVIAINLATDLVYPLIDPRVRLQ